MRTFFTQIGTQNNHWTFHYFNSILIAHIFYSCILCIFCNLSQKNPERKAHTIKDNLKYSTNKNKDPKFLP